MPTLLDFIERATSGPLLTEEDFNMRVLIPNIRKTLRDFEIRYNPEGPPGTALLMTAYYMAGILLFQGAYHLTEPIHFKYGSSTMRDCLWVFSVTGRATSRNIPYPAIGIGYAAAGPGTGTYYHEAADVNLCCVNAGYGGVQTVHPAKAVIEDGITPLEAFVRIA